MVEIKLEALVLADDYNYIKYEALSFPYTPLSDNNRFPHYNTISFLNSLDTEYGLFYKFILGYNSDGQPTLGLIIEWDDTYFYVLSWNNGRPNLISTITLTFIRAKQYVGLAGIIKDVSDYLIEESLTVTQQYESIKKLDLRVSRASFDLVGEDSIRTFIDKYWTTNQVDGYYHVMGVWIKEDGVGRFWGFTRPENITYDPDANVYTIDAYDWMKFLLDTKGVNQLPDHKTINLSTFLEENLVVFNTLDVDINGMSETWDGDDYNYINEGGVISTVESSMTVEDMISECIKYYGSYIYYDGDKNLVFKNRRVFNETINIDDKVLGGEIFRSYKLRDYDSLLINVKGEWIPIGGGSYTQAEQWALVWYFEGELESLIVNSDLSNIPIGRRYLDLRQKIPFESFSYRLFQALDRGEVLNQYQDLLIDSPIYDATLIGTSYNLNDKCVFEDNEYMIKNCEIDFANQITKVLLERV